MTDTEIQKYGNKYQKRARQQVEVNESIILRGKREITGAWEGFAKRVAETGKFDFEILRKWSEKEVAGVLSQFLLISALRGVESGLYETQVGAYAKEGQRGKGAKGKRVADGDVGAPKMRGRTGAGLAFKETDMFTYYYKPFEEIIKEFKKKKLLSKAEFDELSEAMKRQAFTVTGAETNRVLLKIQSELQQVLLGKDTLPDFYDQVIGLFASCDIIGEGNHVETVLRTNLQTQYTDQRMKIYKGLDREEFPYLCIEIVDDDATRDEHRALNGFTARADDPVWGWLTPPLDYNCRCSVRACHATEGAEESGWVPDSNEYGFTRNR